MTKLHDSRNLAVTWNQTGRDWIYCFKDFDGLISNAAILLTVLDQNQG